MARVNDKKGQYSVALESIRAALDRAPSRPAFHYELGKIQRELCYGCHTGVRAQFSMPFKHRVNEGFMQCSDCHNPHGTPPPSWSMGQRPRMVEQVATNEEACMKCHSDKRGPFVFEHAPVRFEGCAGFVACVAALQFLQRLIREHAVFDALFVPLDQVAQITKVSASYFRSLENGECARWPGGIYGRGFVRSYAIAIGLDPDDAVAIFVECYPELAKAILPEPDPEVQEAPPQTPLEKLKAAVGAWFQAAVHSRR